MSADDETGREESRPVAVPSEQSQHLTIRRIERSGPMPDADELQRYEDVVPGLADRIAVQFEREAEHRRRVEVDESTIDHDYRKLGLFAGSALQLAVIVGTVALALDGKEIAASALIASGSIPSLTTIWKSWRRDIGDD